MDAFTLKNSPSRDSSKISPGLGSDSNCPDADGVHTKNRGTTGSNLRTHMHAIWPLLRGLQA
jgi:hypothetical protein